MSYSDVERIITYIKDIKLQEVADIRTDWRVIKRLEQIIDYCEQFRDTP